MREHRNKEGICKQAVNKNVLRLEITVRWNQELIRAKTNREWKVNNTSESVLC